MKHISQSVALQEENGMRPFRYRDFTGLAKVGLEVGMFFYTQTEILRNVTDTYYKMTEC
jgi:hypothetical protein